MSSTSSKHIYFGPFEVTDQVFYTSSLCHALVNIKPLMPGHVLVIPHRGVQRFTDLSTAEVTDVFTTVQKVQQMLARNYFSSMHSKSGNGRIEDGSFNLAIQDGPDAGMTVPHVHCHIIPRLKDSNEGDEIYDRMNSEEGNIGGGLWDKSRPKAGSKFPKIEDAQRKPRSAEEMGKEAAFFRDQMSLIDDGGRG